MFEVQDNILGNIEKEKAAFGHITAGKKISGKEFLARFAYIEDDYLVFIYQDG